MFHNVHTGQQFTWQDDRFRLEDDNRCWRLRVRTGD